MVKLLSKKASLVLARLRSTRRGSWLGRRQWATPYCPRGWHEPQLTPPHFPQEVKQRHYKTNKRDDGSEPWSQGGSESFTIISPFLILRNEVQTVKIFSILGCSGPTKSDLPKPCQQEREILNIIEGLYRFAQDLFPKQHYQKIPREVKHCFQGTQPASGRAGSGPSTPSTCSSLLIAATVREPASDRQSHRLCFRKRGQHLGRGDSIFLSNPFPVHIHIFNNFCRYLCTYIEVAYLFP